MSSDVPLHMLVELHADLNQQAHRSTAAQQDVKGRKPRRDPKVAAASSSVGMDNKRNQAIWDGNTEHPFWPYRNVLTLCPQPCPSSEQRLRQGVEQERQRAHPISVVGAMILERGDNAAVRLHGKGRIQYRLAETSCTAEWCSTHETTHRFGHVVHVSSPITAFTHASSLQQTMT